MRLPGGTSDGLVSKCAFACVPGCGPAGRQILHRLYWLTGLMTAIAITPITAPVRAAGLTDPVVHAPSFPRQVLALENPGRAERSLISLDPVAARVVAGTWKMPVKDEVVTFKNGQVRHWQLVQAKTDGTYELAGRGGYLAAEIGSEDERVMILEASGHAMVYVNGEPRGGDPYSHGYVRQPIQLPQRVQHILVSGRSRSSDHRPAARAVFLILTELWRQHHSRSGLWMSQ